MKPAAKLSKLTSEDWVEKGLEFVQQVGHPRLSIDKIAKWLGVTKGAFYYHFSDKAEYEQALLDHYVATTIQNLSKELSLLSSPQMRLRAVLKKQIEIDHTRLSMIFRAWGLENQSVAEALKKMDQLRLKHANYLFQDLGFPPREAAVRARVLVTFLQGETGLFCQLSRKQRMGQLEERFRFFAEIDDQATQTSLDLG